MGTKVVYSACYGGFGLSRAALNLGRKISGDKDWDAEDIPRHDSVLVQVVEALGNDASDRYSELRIKEINSDKYFIDEYDGFESVVTPNDIEWVLVK